MADDTEESSTLAVLSKRVDFRGWKQSMLLYAMEKGDVDGIFTDDGSDAARGYQLIPAPSHARRQSWKLLSGKLTGRVGRQITNPTLRDVWNTAITSASVAVPSQAQYQFALAMRAVEDACGGVEETAKQIARTRFKVALMTFEEQSTKGDVKAGFETYADGIRVAEQKLAHAGVIMSDEEKKEKFFAGFNPRSAQWNSVKTFWMQSDHTFDDILSRGVQQQHSLDAVEAEDNASGVRSFMAKSMRDEERNNECDYDRFNKRTKRDEESAHAHYTARGAGGKGGKSGNGSRVGRLANWDGKGGRGNGKGGGRGYGGKGGRFNRDRGGGKGNTAKFDGDCRNCGKYGHKAADCWSKPNGGSKGKGGKGKPEIYVPGFSVLVDTGGGYLGGMFEYLLFGLLVYYLYIKVVASTTAYSTVMAFTAPIIRYGMATVSNGFTNADARFHINCHSSITDNECKRSSVIFDTGASMHIMNSARNLTNFITNNSFKVYGVGGKDKGASASHVGDISLKLKGWTWFGDECTVNLGKGSDANPNSGRAVLCRDAPLSLVSWAELKRAGWKVDESLTCIWHPREKVTVYFEAKHGLLYLPIERCDAHDDAHDDNEEINVAPTGFLSNLMKNYITFGGPDMTKLRKTGELSGLPLDGEGPKHPIREFVMAKLRRVYPKKSDERTDYKPFECVVWDMLGPFRTPSLGGCRFSHDAVDKSTGTRFVYSVTDASAATFIKVLEMFIAFIGSVPGGFVLKIVRADQGSNYTSKAVRQFLSARGIKLQLAAVHTPHQIRVVETAHAVVNATMRAIMHFANAPREMWAVARRYSALLNNIMATRCNQASKAVIPLLALNVKIDYASLLPFGCLIMCHRAKEQVTDGYCDTRGVAGAFVGYSWMDDVKGLMVYLASGKIVTTVFWKADATYFPWRPDGQRRLLPDGSFGDEGETARIFSKIPEPYSFNEILDGVGDTEQQENDGIVTENDETSENGSNSTSGADGENGQNGISEGNGDQIKRELQRGSRICFRFDTCLSGGKYVGPSMRRADAGQDLSRIRWDDKTNYLVKLSQDNRFAGDDSSKMKPGEWMITVDGNDEDIGLSGLIAMCSNSEAQVDEIVFARDHSGVDGLFVPVMAAKAESSEFGPFTYNQVIRRDDWPEWEVAAEKEIDNLISHDTFDLVDISEPMNQGAYVYNTKNVFTIKRDGTKKARLVVRGDEQVWDDWDSAYIDEEPDTFTFDDVSKIQDPNTASGSSDAKVSESNSGSNSQNGSTTEFYDMFGGEGVYGMVSHKVANIYRQLHSPVMTQALMLILLAVGVANGEFFAIADVKGAFLYAMLLPSEVIYCYPPKGYYDHSKFGGGGKVMKLKRALYGIAQAPRRWFEHLVKIFIKHGLKPTVVDPCLFVLNTMAANGFRIKCGTHVDDFLFTTNDWEQFSAWVDGVNKDITFSRFDSIEKGEDYMSLWLTYDRTKSYLQISQSSYIKKALKMFGLEHLKASSTPMATGVKFTRDDMPEIVDTKSKELFQRMIGVARWITRMSCPEATFVVSYLACFLQSPSAKMLKAAVQVFRYFKWTIDNDVEGRRYEARPDHTPPGFNCRVGKNQVYGYVDSSYMSEEQTLCRFGVNFYVNGMSVYEMSRRLPGHYLSSTEAEYYACSIGTCEGKFLVMTLTAMGESQNGPLLIGQDNKSCIQIAENPGRHHGRTKHIELRIRWIEDEIKQEKLALIYVPTGQMVADVLTKSLSYDTFARHSSYLKGVIFPELEKKTKRARLE